MSRYQVRYRWLSSLTDPTNYTPWTSAEPSDSLAAILDEHRRVTLPKDGLDIEWRIAPPDPEMVELLKNILLKYIPSAADSHAAAINVCDMLVREGHLK